MALFIIIIVILLVTLYFYSTRTFNYWNLRGVKGPKPYPMFGTHFDLYTARRSPTQKTIKDYFQWNNEKLVGYFRSTRPEVIVRDPDIIHRVLTSDFAYFYPRGFMQDKSVVEPMLRNLFFADGDIWRLLRQRMTPAFTSGKLKAMFPLVVERAEYLQARLVNIASSNNSIDARDLMARFTTDFIGACGFGLNADSLKEENSAFRQLGVNIFKITPTRFLKLVLKETMPSLCRNIKLLGDLEQDVFDLVNHIIKERDGKPSTRNDFIDLMLECQQKGVMTGESLEKTDPDGNPEIIHMELTDKLIAAQVFIFFAAGFETSSSATSFTLHQLAYHPDIQKRAQNEIDKVLTKYDNKLCYDAIKEMTYLGWTFKEGLRLFPSLGLLKRECAKTYKIPEMDITIDEGVSVVIPVNGLHLDPKYFRDPEVFDPERFSPLRFTDECKKVYMPFGAGPRACIGERLGLMQSLAGLAAVLSKFTVKPAPNTIRHPVVDPKAGVIQSILNGLPLNFCKREHAK